jgi:glutamate dehydrogenase/leucine dehydrogenase
VDFEGLLARWDGEHAVVRHDEESGAWIFVCVHSTALGPAGGGTRMRVYPAPSDGLADAMRLSGAMTRKMAAAGMARGGGKAVLAVPELLAGEPRRRLLRRYGELVASLGGSYRTAGDMNISPEDLDVVAETCPWVYGTTGRGGNSGRGTARGCLHAICATVEHVFGSPDLAGRSVLVQGAGAVGAVLARELAEAGARVLVSDVDEERARATGGEAVPPERVLETRVDVYSPCAVGGTLSSESIPRLACRAVAGCANNQLAEPEDAERLRARGILYAPDYVVNAGGIIQLIGLEDEGWDEAQLEERLAGIGDTLRNLFAEAESEGITPADAAERFVARRLQDARPG